MIDWEQPIAWSTGEPSHFSGEYGSRGPSSFHVAACEEWLDDTGDSYVWVNSDGRILGMEYDYPHLVNQKPADPQQDSA